MQTTLLTKRSWNRQAWHALGILLVILLFAAQAGAQRITGNITGTVKDEQGAMVTTAMVKATNTDTGFNRAAQVGADGTFLIQYLPVGNYTVAIEATGFKKFVQEHVTVAVDQTVPLAVTLTVGAQTQTVEVTEAPPLVETSTAELGRTVSPAEIISLPLVNRNAYSELSLTAGVMSNSASGQSNANGTPNFQIGVPATQVIVNGGIDAGVPMVSFYLDGGINMTGLRNYGNPLPNPDALQEFRVETSNFAAQYGRMSGAVVTAVTKSGTNAFHGSLFEFNRNTDLNAYNWGAITKAPYHRNQFGGAVGGPVKKDKAFFFFSYAGLRQVVGSQLTGAIVPTAAERLGDFTADSGINILMPGTKTPVNGANTSSGCTTITAATAGKCVPQALLDKAAGNLMSKYVPLPNGAAAVSGGGAAYSGFFTGPTNQDEYLAKYDEVLSDRDHVAGSYFYLSTTQNAYGNGNIPYTINQSFAKQNVVNVSDVHTFGMSTANQAWFTLTRVAGGRTNLPTVGLEDLGSTFTTQGPKTLPQLSISGFFSGGGALAGPVSYTTFLSVRDMVSKTLGKHQLDFGGEASLEKDPIRGNLYNFGVFSFSNSAPTTTSNALSDFVTGQVSTMEQDTPYHSLTSTWYSAFFLQDNYRVAQRVNLNLGLRYDVQQAPVEASNLTATFVPGIQSTMVPSAPLGMLFPGDKGVPRGITSTRWHHVSPRVGVSWDPFGDGKTAIRAGAGLFYGSVAGNEWNQPANAQPFAVRQTGFSVNSFTNIYAPTLANGAASSFPNGDIFPYTYAPASPRFISAASIETIGQQYQWPLTYQFNTAVQRQLPHNVSATVAYVGTLTRHMPFFIDANYAPYAAGATTNANNINSRRPYDPALTAGQLGTLGQVTYLESQENASYHSLQITASRPLTHNVMINGFYVWSHNLETVNPDGDGQGTAQDFDNLWEERGRTDNDRRHVASMSGTWTLDYYKGENKILKQAVDGWQISPIVSLQAGTPFTITTGSNKNFDSANANRPNLVPGVNPVLDAHRSRGNSASTSGSGTAAGEWFNTAAFIANGPGVAGGIGPGGADGNSRRDFLTGPGYRDIDLGLLREFRFERGIVFQLRGEAVNAFNMVSLNGPNTTLSSSSFGHITAAGTPRLIQVGGRLTF
jgi:hypothetical protein